MDEEAIEMYPQKPKLKRVKLRNLEKEEAKLQMKLQEIEILYQKTEKRKLELEKTTQRPITSKEQVTLVEVARKEKKNPRRGRHPIEVK